MAEVAAENEERETTLQANIAKLQEKVEKQKAKSVSLAEQITQLEEQLAAEKVGAQRCAGAAQLCDCVAARGAGRHRGGACVRQQRRQ